MRQRQVPAPQDFGLLLGSQVVVCFCVAEQFVPVTTLSKASPSQALVSRNGELLFGADFLVPMTHPGNGSLRSFMTGGSTGLTGSPGSPMEVPGDPMTALPLGLWQHPVEDILYVGLPARNKLGVFSFGSNGGLVYITEVNNSGAAVCWVRTTADGAHTYTLNSLSNSISFYNTSSATSPSESQHFLLSQPGPNGPGWLRACE